MRRLHVLVSINPLCVAQVALCVLMAHIGSFVPAAEAEMGVFDAIYTRLRKKGDAPGEGGEGRAL